MLYKTGVEIKLNHKDKKDNLGLEHKVMFIILYFLVVFVPFSSIIQVIFEF